MENVDIYKVEDLIVDAIEDIAQNRDINEEEEEYIEAIVTGGYPPRGIIEFTTKDGIKRFKITIEVI